MKSWSIFSVDVVAMKKSKVFWSSWARSSETERRMGRMSWRECSPAASPFFRVSACSKARESCFWIASVYWLPPKEMSRQKIVLEPDRMLTFVTEAPMLTRATTRPGSTG